MKKRVLLVVLIFILVFSLIPAALAEGSDTSSPIEQPTVSEEPVVSPEPTDEPETTEDPDAMPPLNAAGMPMGKVFNELGISSMTRSKEELSDAQKKLSTSLLQLTDSKFLPAALTQTELVNRMKAMKQIRESSDAYVKANDVSGLDVYVYVKAKKGCSLDVVEPYVSKIVSKDETAGLCAAWVNATSIEALASQNEVASIREVHAPVVNAGSLTSEGYKMLNADHVNDLGFDGTGVKVGILSDGVNHWEEARDSGDLPATVHVLSDANVGDEGTAMLEIVHDLAPGAELYFHDCGDNTIEFNAAIDELVAAGCKVICDDISWIQQPFFEDGPDGTVANHITEVLAAHPDIVYTSSAGNFAYEHYQGKFVSWKHTEWNDFSGGDHPKDSSLYIYIPPYIGDVDVILQWNDPFGASSNDYDLHLKDWNYYDFVSEGYQDGDDDPIEEVALKNTGSTGVYLNIEVENVDAAVKTLEIYIYGYCKVYRNNIVTKDSIFGHPAVPGVIACGAIDGRKADGSDEYNKLEYFSSRGPVTMLDGVRKKPDICGIDGVAVTGVGGFGSPFYGTSAASPHIAAVAALLMERFDGDKTGTEIRQIILDNRTDMGAAGYDYSYGWGKSDALAAVKSYNYVMFNSLGGDTTPATQLVARKAKVTAPTVPTNGNLYLEGWYTDTDYAASHKWNFSTNTVTADMILYAHWVYRIGATSNNKYYGTVTGGGNYLKDVPVTLKATPKPGYRFVSWMEGTTVVTTNADYPFTPTSDRTFVAQFAKIGTPADLVISSPHYNKVDLSWSAVDGATGYGVYRATSKYGTYKNISGYFTDGTTYHDTVSKWGVRYYYKVKAYCKTTTTTIPDITTYGSKSGYKYITPDWIKPTLAAAKLNYHIIQLTWNDVRDADSYTVYRSTSSSGTYKPIEEGIMKLAGATGVTFTDEMTASMIGKTYYYKVRPVDDNGGIPVKGPYSKYAAAKASWQNPNLKAATDTYHSVRLSWDKDPEAHYYIVYRNTKYYGTYTVIPGAEKVTTPYYVDDNLPLGKTYYYKVQPIDEDLLSTVGTGPISGYKYAKADWPALGLTAVSGGYDSVNLDWNDINGADRYQVYYNTKSTGTYMEYGSLISVSNATVTDLMPGTTYYFKIKAIDSVPDPDVTHTYSYKYAKPVPATPANLQAVNAETSMTVTWNAVDGGPQYQVYRATSKYGTYSCIATTNLTSAASTGLKAGKTYYYKVRAYMVVDGKKVYGSFTAPFGLKFVPLTE